MSAFRHLDWELLGTVAIVFSFENILEIIFNLVIPPSASLVGWAAILVVVAYKTAEEAEENDREA